MDKIQHVEIVVNLQRFPGTLLYVAIKCYHTKGSLLEINLQVRV